VFLKEILCDLRDEVWRVKRDNDELQGMLAEDDSRANMRQPMFPGQDGVARRREFDALLAEVAALAESNSKKDDELKQLRAKGRCNVFMWLLACLVALAVAYARVQY
jgi:hypothetical protein